MIPGHWAPHRREDGELIGYLAPAAEVLPASALPEGAPRGEPAAEGDAVVPVTLFGLPLAGPGEEQQGRQRLEALGLSYLAEPWTLLLSGRQERLQVQIVELSPERMSLRSIDIGDEQGYGRILHVTVPVTPELLVPAHSSLLR